jgi:undecaprenyl phosphate N,N'-diacetylbacillosamine 1-phosphate transferase
MEESGALISEGIRCAIERIIAVIALVVFSPLFLILVALIKLTSTGPALFLSERLGKYGQVFHMKKFRSMVDGASTIVSDDAKTVVAQDDPRLTIMGRLLRAGFDELPQLINVLAGDMSFVGPRPDAVWMEPRYTPAIKERLNVRPGITGLAQVLDARSKPTAVGYALDVYYARNRTVGLDIKILLMTVPYVLGWKSIGVKMAEKVFTDPAYRPTRFEPMLEVQPNQDGPSHGGIPLG